MTPQQRLAGLRVGLKFASAANRPEIERMIAALEAEPPAVSPCARMFRRAGAGRLWSI